MKNKLTRNNKLVTILLHLRRKKMEKSSYQRLRTQLSELEEKLYIADTAIREIANLPLDQTFKGKDIAIKALTKLYEKK